MLPVTVDGIRLFLHILAATIWVGGQLTLGALVPALRRAGADIPRVAARAFGRVGWTAFAVLVVTGIWNIAAVGAHERNASGYQATLGLKLTFVVLSGIAAWWHSRGSTRLALALGGAGAAVFSLAALLLGVVLVEH